VKLGALGRRNDLRPDFAATLQQSVDDPLADSAAPLDALLALALCMLRASPPMNVSSLSTVPPSLRNVPVRMASRMRWSMNHAVFCVTPAPGQARDC
jgi:hypothetical protein